MPSATLFLAGSDYFLPSSNPVYNASHLEFWAKLLDTKNDRQPKPCRNLSSDGPRKCLFLHGQVQASRPKHKPHYDTDHVHSHGHDHAREQEINMGDNDTRPKHKPHYDTDPYMVTIMPENGKSTQETKGYFSEGKTHGPSTNCTMTQTHTRSWSCQLVY